MNRSRIIRSFGACTAMLLALVLACAGCSDQNATPEQLIASAKQARDKGQYRAAIIHLKGALQQAPQNAEVRFLLGATFNDVADFKSAEIELRRALELRYDLAKVEIGKSLLMMRQYQKVLDDVPMDANVGNAVEAEILTLRAVASIGLGRHREGREMLEQALAKQPEFANALLAQARIAIGENKVEEASKLIERAVASAPKNVDAWLMKGDLSEYKADPAGALAAYQKVVEISAENFPAQAKITQFQITAGNFDEARKGLAQLRKISPGNPLINYLLALMEFRQKKFTAARDAVLLALKGSPDSLPILQLAGTIEYSLGAHAQAQAHLARVVERVPRALTARKLLIASLLKTGQLQRAIEMLQPGLLHASEDGELMTLAGEVYMQKSDFPKAVQYFEMAAKLDPKSESARIGLGLSRFGSGETDRGLADLESAVELDSKKYRADVVLVQSYLQRGKYDDALRAMQSLEKKQPRNPLTYNLKAGIYLAKKDEASARKNLEHALELNPLYIAAATNLAQLDIQDNKPAAARRRFEVMLEKDKDNTDALMALARFTPRIGATSKDQIAWLERARKASPNLVAPQLMLALAHAQSGDPKQALQIAQQAQAAHPDDLSALDMLGALQLAGGAKEQALTTYNRLVSLQPKSAAALVALARAQEANANRKGAADTLRKALSLQPDFIDAQLALASLEVSAGHYAYAMKIAQQMRKQSAKAPIGYILEGDVMMAEKKFKQAAKLYEAAYGLDKSSNVLIKLHAAYLQAGNADEAEGRLAQWLKESPDDEVVRLYAAESDLKSGNYKNAIAQYEWLLKRRPDNSLLLNNLAWAYQQTKDARALETAERAYKLNPASAQAADTLGWILVEQGNTKRGIELLQRAVIAAPQDPENRYHLAQAFVKAGDHVSARQELEKLVADSSGSRIGKEARQLLDKLP